MNINYAWLELASYDEVILKKFCQTKNDVEFCFWFGSDISGCLYSFQEVIGLILKSMKNEKNYEWGGNNSILEISAINTYIYYPMFEERYKYETVDFLNELRAAFEADKKERNKGHV